MSKMHRLFYIPLASVLLCFDQGTASHVPALTISLYWYLISCAPDIYQTKTMSSASVKHAGVGQWPAYFYLVLCNLLCWTRKNKNTGMCLRERGRFEETLKKKNLLQTIVNNSFSYSWHMIIMIYTYFFINDEWCWW